MTKQTNKFDTRASEVMDKLDSAEEITEFHHSIDEIPWITVRKIHGKIIVRYWCHGGFSLDNEIDDDTCRLIQQAIAYGKYLRNQEIKQLLGIKE